VTALVHFDHVRKDYRGASAPALVDVSFDIFERDRIALMGRSGSGKSTILNLIAGLDEATAGEVRWPRHGHPMAGDIGLAFQSPSLIPWLTVEENVRLPLLISTATRPGDPRDLLAQLGLGDHAPKLPSELSGGQAQRVALARAMVTTPRLLLADEPSGQLDHETAIRVLETLQGWADGSGTALVIATHDPAVAASAQRCWTLDHGHLAEIPA
jgi:ABC-type lipoprotein export system ATPase subunit